MSREKENLTLSDLIRGIQHCVNSSVEVAEQHYLQTLSRFFNKDGTPVTQTIRLKNNVQINLPLICLSSHGSLDFEEMKIKTRLNIRNIRQKLLKTGLNCGDENYQFTRGSFSVSLGDSQNQNGDNSLAEIEMVFKRRDSPEALARLIDHINNMVQLEEINESEEHV